MTKSVLGWFLAAIGVLVLDQASKLIILAKVSPFETIEVFSFFNIVYAENTGSAFGMFKGMGSAFFIVIALVAVAVLGFLIFREKGAYRAAYALLLGGAAGNLTDRVRFGHVIDFLDFHVAGYHWPAFNVADSALTIGIGILMLAIIMDGKKQDAARVRDAGTRN